MFSCSFSTQLPSTDSVHSRKAAVLKWEEVSQVTPSTSFHVEHLSNYDRGASRSLCMLVTRRTATSLLSSLPRPWSRSTDKDLLPCVPAAALSQGLTASPGHLPFGKKILSTSPGLWAGFLWQGFEVGRQLL